jgi:hypothetical protein
MERMWNAGSGTDDRIDPTDDVWDCEMPDDDTPDKPDNAASGSVVVGKIKPTQITRPFLAPTFSSLSRQSNNRAENRPWSFARLHRQGALRPPSHSPNDDIPRHFRFDARRPFPVETRNPETGPFPNHSANHDYGACHDFRFDDHRQHRPLPVDAGRGAEAAGSNPDSGHFHFDLVRRDRSAERLARFTTSGPDSVQILFSPPFVEWGLGFDAGQSNFAVPDRDWFGSCRQRPFGSWDPAADGGATTTSRRPFPAPPTTAAGQDRRFNVVRGDHRAPTSGLDRRWPACQSVDRRHRFTDSDMEAATRRSFYGHPAPSRAEEQLGANYLPRGGAAAPAKEDWKSRYRDAPGGESPPEVYERAGQGSSGFRQFGGPVSGTNRSNYLYLGGGGGQCSSQPEVDPPFYLTPHSFSTDPEPQLGRRSVARSCDARQYVSGHRHQGAPGIGGGAHAAESGPCPSNRMHESPFHVPEVTYADGGADGMQRRSESMSSGFGSSQRSSASGSYDGRGGSRRKLRGGRLKLRGGRLGVKTTSRPPKLVKNVFFRSLTPPLLDPPLCKKDGQARLVFVKKPGNNGQTQLAFR